MVTLIDLNILIFLDRMETLAVCLVSEIVAVFGGYMIKAYLGKRNEEENKLRQEETGGVEE